MLHVPVPSDLDGRNGNASQVERWLGFPVIEIPISDLISCKVFGREVAFGLSSGSNRSLFNVSSSVLSRHLSRRSICNVTSDLAMLFWACPPSYFGVLERH